MFGSFIHLETDRKGQKPRIFDLSKRIMASARRHIVGETSVHNRPSKNIWAPSNSYIEGGPQPRSQSGIMSKIKQASPTAATRQNTMV